MNTTYLILLVLLIIYIPTFIYVKKSEKAKALGFVTSGPMIMIKTKMGVKLMDRLCVYKRFWRFMGVLSRFITLFLMVFIVSIIVIDLIAIPGMTSTGGLGIEYALAIPGLNPMLPLVYGWVALIIAMVVHEFAHGVQTRTNDMQVESTGILHCVVPLGAFVEPNEEQVQKCSRQARMDLYAAGITTNFILAMIVFIVMCAGMTGGLTTQYGDNPSIYAVSGSSPGFDSGIPTSAIITDIDGNAVTSVAQLYEFIDDNYCKEYDISYVYWDMNFTKTVTMGTYVEGVVKGSPSDGLIQKGTFLLGISDTDSETITTYFGTPTSFTSFMKTTHPGDMYKFYTMDYKTGDEEILLITLGERNGYGYAGISTSLSGFSFITPNNAVNVAVDPFYNCNTIQEKAMGMLSYVGHAFNGFSPVPEATHWWYHSTILPDEIFWPCMTLLYWIFWLNIVLAITNAIPAVPFDGGFLFSGGIDYILEKLGMKNQEKRDKINDNIVKVVSAFMIFALALVIIIMII